MARHNYILLIAVVLWLGSGFVSAQDKTPSKWFEEKIRGERFIPYRMYDGDPFYNPEWEPGKIRFTNGETLDSLFLKYSSYADELIYFNSDLNAMITIDKESIESFSLETGDGLHHEFRRQDSDHLAHGNHFYEVLYDGNTSLLSYRRVELLQCSPYYHDITKSLVNQIYSRTNKFYLYSKEGRDCRIRPKRGSLYLQFTKQEKKEIRKLLRNEHIAITDEKSFVKAWAVIDQNGYTPQFISE